MLTQHITTVTKTATGEIKKTEEDERTLFSYDELAPHAQQRALEFWSRYQNEDPDILRFAQETCIDVVQACGVRLDTRSVMLMNGTTRQDPILHYSLGGNDDGVSFSGRWEYDPGALREMKKEWPLATKLHDILRRLSALVKQHPKLRCGVQECGHRGHNIKIGWAEWTTRAGNDRDELPGTLEEELLECFTDLAHWCLCTMRDDLDYQTGEERFKDECEDMNLLFDESGNRVEVDCTDPQG